MNEEDKDYLVYDVILKDSTAATSLYELFSKDSDAAAKYFKEGRQFWNYDYEQERYVLITVTYVRSGIVFYVREDCDNKREDSFGVKSIMARMLYPRVIYLQEVADAFREYMPDFDPDDLVKMYKRMKLDIPADYVKIDIDFTIN